MTDYTKEGTNCIATNNCLDRRDPTYYKGSWQRGPSPNLYDGKYTAYFSDLQMSALGDPTKAGSLNLKGKVNLGTTSCGACLLQVMLFVWSRNNP